MPATSPRFQEKALLKTQRPVLRYAGQTGTVPPFSRLTV